MDGQKIELASFRDFPLFAESNAESNALQGEVTRYPTDRDIKQV
jgi:hypothetical protein